jgi:hypothetical protein
MRSIQVCCGSNNHIEIRSEDVSLFDKRKIPIVLVEIPQYPLGLEQDLRTAFDSCISTDELKWNVLLPSKKSLNSHVPYIGAVFLHHIARICDQ